MEATVSTLNESVSAPAESTSVESTAVESTENSGSARVSMESFIMTWEEVANGPNPSVQTVADKLNLKKESVQQRATKYRTQHGVALSNMPRGGGAKFKAEEAQALLAKIKADREAAAEAAASNS